MKSLLSFFVTFLLFVLTASAAPIQLHWNLCKGATLENRDGKQYLCVVVRPEDKDAVNCANATFNLAPYANSLVEFTIRVRAREVSKPANFYNGVKFMLNFIDASGKEYWRNVSNLDGTFDWREISFSTFVGKPGKKSQLQLGLQESSGEVEFDLGSLQIVKVFTAPSEAYKAVYSDAVASTPPLRGVMSPYRFKEEDFDTLAQWNVNLVRAQMTRNWAKVGTDRDLGEFDSWLDDLLTHYEKMFPIGYEKGIRFVMDLHTPPGGRYQQGLEMAMFHEKEYADHFVEVWKKIATRFKDNPAVWGYDLINEPAQIRRAPYDYWNLQRRAAEAIREIDPERPIIIESNEWDWPQAFHYLAPLKLKNIIYQVHMYSPMAYTGQNVVRPLKPGEKLVAYPGRIDGTNYNKETLQRDLEPVREFQKKYGVRIYVGEFSAVLWAPGAANYLRDCIEIFEEYGWDWSYHAFREWRGNSLEHEGTNHEDLHPAPDTDRKRVVLDGFRKNRTN